MGGVSNVGGLGPTLLPPHFKNIMRVHLFTWLPSQHSMRQTNADVQHIILTFFWCFSSSRNSIFLSAFLRVRFCNFMRNSWRFFVVTIIPTNTWIHVLKQEPEHQHNEQMVTHCMYVMSGGWHHSTACVELCHRSCCTHPRSHLELAPGGISRSFSVLIGRKCFGSRRNHLTVPVTWWFTSSILIIEADHGITARLLPPTSQSLSRKLRGFIRLIN